MKFLYFQLVKHKKIGVNVSVGRGPGIPLIRKVALIKSKPEIKI
jgi:hypothetical protein